MSQVLNSSRLALKVAVHLQGVTDAVHLSCTYPSTQL